jgi:hypothetical protein
MILASDVVAPDDPDPRTRRADRPKTVHRRTDCAGDVRPAEASDQVNPSSKKRSKPGRNLLHLWIEAGPCVRETPCLPLGHRPLTHPVEDEVLHKAGSREIERRLQAIARLRRARSDKGTRLPHSRPPALSFLAAGVVVFLTDRVGWAIQAGDGVEPVQLGGVVMKDLATMSDRDIRELVFDRRLGVRPRTVAVREV